ncbi:MAG TPA: hypothetical protein VN737_14725 [Bryobacteraceae bacterium]|nr:hypothetical protein [Bryobacteraceae bacterium]
MKVGDPLRRICDLLNHPCSIDGAVNGLTDRIRLVGMGILGIKGNLYVD